MTQDNTLTLPIEGMTCAWCANRARDSLRLRRFRALRQDDQAAEEPRADMELGAGATMTPSSYSP